MEQYGTLKAKNPVLCSGKGALKAPPRRECFLGREALLRGTRKLRSRINITILSGVSQEPAQSRVPAGAGI